MIFQEPMSSLNPCFTVGFQLTEALKIHHRHGPRGAPRARAIELLEPGRHLRRRSAARAPSRTSSPAA